VRDAGAPKRAGGVVGVPGVVPVGVVLTGVGVTVATGGVGIDTGTGLGGTLGLPGLWTGTLTGFGARVVGWVTVGLGWMLGRLPAAIF
jgi:hypothetical protein